jgi:hypothetical protein
MPSGVEASNRTEEISQYGSILQYDKKRGNCQIYLAIIVAGMGSPGLVKNTNLQ